MSSIVSEPIRRYRQYQCAIVLFLQFCCHAFVASDLNRACAIETRWKLVLRGDLMSRLRIAGLALTALFAVGMFTSAARAQSASGGGEEGVAAAEPYPNMPWIPPIGVRTGKYFDVPASAQGPAVDPAKGYRLQDFGGGLYMITDNQIQSMFLVYDRGVVVMDAPQSYAAKIPQAIKEVAGDKPITHLIYSHSHADHIGGAKALGDVPVIISQDETMRLLKRDADPNRPLPTVTFADKYTLHVRSEVLELTYHGSGHAPGNIFIYAPKQRVLMVLTPCFPAGCPGVGLPFRKMSLTNLLGSRMSARWIGIRSLAATLLASALMPMWRCRRSSTETSSRRPRRPWPRPRSVKR